MKFYPPIALVLFVLVSCSNEEVHKPAPFQKLVEKKVVENVQHSITYTTHYNYNRKGQATSFEEWSAHEGESRLENSTELMHDDNKRLVEQKSLMPNGINRNTIFNYDENILQSVLIEQEGNYSDNLILVEKPDESKIRLLYLTGLDINDDTSSWSVIKFENENLVEQSFYTQNGLIQHYEIEYSEKRNPFYCTNVDLITSLSYESKNLPLKRTYTYYHLDGPQKTVTTYSYEEDSKYPESYSYSVDYHDGGNLEFNVELTYK